jgi:hypothetical protein
MQRIKRIIALAAITVTAAGTIPAIAAADTNTGSGSGSAGVWTKEACDAAPALIDTLDTVKSALDPNGSAYAAVDGAQQHAIDGYIENCG